jgi:hypothetical protein
MTADKMTGRDFLKIHGLSFACLIGVFTPGVEIAALRRVTRIGNLAGQAGNLIFFFRIGFRHRAYQCFRIGMPGIFKQFHGSRKFNDLADIHDRNPVAYIFNNAQIMADKQKGKLQTLL